MELHTNIPFSTEALNFANVSFYLQKSSFFGKNSIFTLSKVMIWRAVFVSNFSVLFSGFVR